MGSYREAMVTIVKAIQYNLYYTVVQLVNNDLHINVQNLTTTIFYSVSVVAIINYDTLYAYA